MFLLRITLVLSAASFAIPTGAWASVTCDLLLVRYDREIDSLQKYFAAGPQDLKTELRHRVGIDQYMRAYFEQAEHSLTPEQLETFRKSFGPRWTQIDTDNTEFMKRVLGKYEWITISEFGAEADSDAWILVQHADLDLEFQREVLKRLEKFYPLGETSGRNYAYLYDRVAVSNYDPSRARPQRFGTQASFENGRYETGPLEDAENVDALRAAVGLEPLAEYFAKFR